jgi:diacylglycerol kinase family enzyme
VALGSGLVALLAAQPRLRLQMERDGQSHALRSTTLVVGNNRLQLEQIGMPEAAEVEHGRLVGIAMPPVSRLRMVLTAARGLLGHLSEDRQVRDFSFNSLEVAVPRRSRIKLALDGEIMRMSLPLRFEVAPKKLRLLVPREAGAPR